MKILKEDLSLVKARIEEIQLDLKDLAKEFNEALNQSSETWHDNAPWDDAKAREKLLLTELSFLQNIARTYRVIAPSKKEVIGSFQKIKFNGRGVKIYVAGDFSMRTGQQLDGHTIVTPSSPIVKSILS